MEEKKKRLVSQLIAHFNGDKTRVKQVGDACKTLGFNLSNEKNLNSIADNPEAFFTIITFADFGVIAKLQQALDLLNNKE